ncbi:MAG TPA: hypothetical protein PLS63_07680 [Microthrixaceae bacterium]|nr:hypothetical protein [Microthrixaceae bacterium]
MADDDTAAQDELTHTDDRAEPPPAPASGAAQQQRDSERSDVAMSDPSHRTGVAQARENMSNESPA